MKIINVLILFMLFFFIPFNSYSQVRPSIQFTAGLTFPGNEFQGELVSVNDSGITNINSDFIKKNYGVSTGASITGALKFPLNQNGIFYAVLIGSYSYFNAFRKSYLGATIVNNAEVPVSFDNRFTASTFGLGMEARPASDSKISPYVNADFTFNLLSLTLLKNDYYSILFNDAFRIGLLSQAGVNVKLSSEYSFAVEGSYHLSNLFLKSNSSSYQDRIMFDRENIPVNDGEGSYYSNISTPNSAPSPVSGSNKNITWWNINLGIKIMLGKSGKK